ncbi:MAG TPA: carboxypeptidase regulatory-like domain-containing protein [Nitrospirales bacterium]|nr:carboxypeptidase regulatory-like domain-containing protein [Nitrospirales bacterium]
MRKLISLICGLLLAAGASPAFSYDEVSVQNGGTLSGTIALSGAVPKPKGYNLVTFPDPVYCGRISDGQGWRLLPTFRASSDGGLADVVIVIEGIDRGKPFAAAAPRIEAIDCLFKPGVTVVRDRAPVEVINMDPVMHDIQAYETSELGPRVLFNVPLPMNPHHPREASMSAQYHRHLPGEPMRQIVKMTKGRKGFVMQCGFHAYMESWGLAVDNPYYAITDASGRFSIPDIPPGTYAVTIWHPRIGSRQSTITIAEGGAATLSMSLEAPTGRLYANEAMDNPRFGLAIMGDAKIVPTVERQRP